MTSLQDFNPPGYKPGADVLVLGMSPSKNSDKPRKNGTCNTLSGWMGFVGCNEWDFHNVIPNVINSSSMRSVDKTALFEAVAGRRKIVALGGFVSRVCDKYNVPYFRIDHPSPRNRNFNDPDYEPRMLGRLYDYLWSGRLNGKQLKNLDTGGIEIIDADRPD